MPQVALRDEDGALAILRDSVAAFARQNPGPARLRLLRGKGGMNQAVWRKIAEAGWIGLLVSEEAGGPGLSVREQVVVSESLGGELAPEPYAMLSVFAPAVLSACPASPRRELLLTGAISGERLVSVAWQDRRGGREMTAKEDASGEWILDGEKAFVEAAGDATDLLVVASHGAQTCLFAVDPSSPGVTITQRAGVDGGALSNIAFHDVRIGQDRKLAVAPSAGALLDQALARTRLAIAAELAGLANKALEITVEYTRQRVQFGKPIASFQVIQHRLVDMWMQAELASAAVRNAAELCVGNSEAAAASTAILAAKARASDAASMICRNAIHLHGAMGYTDECDIGLYLKRAINLGALLGNADAMRRLFIENNSHPRH
ncbi:acyl-CoA dehydrogenase family protein [Methylocapsa sp. S129]|uniref:acyl-CoA dehydrogenase family protein n=1 Tax=Methylocapsa sp. S129 TaxID=1641869 RepID=UPI001AEF0790|nr:acyl-CoA dehydrogenase family protein [Methylocapsa sp. S129]